MRITEGLSTKDKQAIIHWTNSKGADFLQQWAGDALPYPLTMEALNALSHCFRIEVEGSFIGMIQQIRVEGSNVHIGNDNPIAKGLYTKLGFEVVATIEGERKKYKMMKSNSAIN